MSIAHDEELQKRRIQKDSSLPEGPAGPAVLA
jgi:hypothetical protein